MNKLFALVLVAVGFNFSITTVFAQSVVMTQTLPPGTAEAVNFVDPNLDHRFVTAYQGEIRIVRERQIGGSSWPWVEETDRFLVWTSPLVGLTPVCRFFTRPATGWNSHFYSSDPVECDFVKTDPVLSAVWQLETDAAFYLAKARKDTYTNEWYCQSGTIPAFRFYNNGLGGQPNHVFTTSYAVREDYLTKGWTPEGLLGCSPTVTDKVIVANGSAVLLGQGSDNCINNVSVFDVATLTGRDVCTVGILPFNVVVTKQDGMGKLALTSNIQTIDLEKVTVTSSSEYQYRVWDWIVVDDGAATLYATYSTSDHQDGVATLDMTGKIVKEYSSGALFGYTPFYITMVGDKLYVLNQRYSGGSGWDSPSDWVVVINKNTGAFLSKIAVAPNPLGAAYDPKRGKLYVSSVGDDTRGLKSGLVAIDVRTDAIVENLRFPGAKPLGLYFDTASDRLWVANNNKEMFSPNDSLEVFDIKSGIWMTSIPTHWWPTYFIPVFRADGTRELWVGYSGAGGGEVNSPYWLANNWGIGRFNLDTMTTIQKRMVSAPGPLGMAGRLKYQ